MEYYLIAILWCNYHICFFILIYRKVLNNLYQKPRRHYVDCRGSCWRLVHARIFHFLNFLLFLSCLLLLLSRFILIRLDFEHFPAGLPNSTSTNHTDRIESVNLLPANKTQSLLWRKNWRLVIFISTSS